MQTTTDTYPSRLFAALLRAALSAKGDPLGESTAASLGISQAHMDMMISGASHPRSFIMLDRLVALLDMDPVEAFHAAALDVATSALSWAAESARRASPSRPVLDVHEALAGADLEPGEATALLELVTTNEGRALLRAVNDIEPDHRAAFLSMSANSSFIDRGFLGITPNPHGSIVRVGRPPSDRMLAYVRGLNDKELVRLLSDHDRALVTAKKGKAREEMESTRNAILAEMGRRDHSNLNETAQKKERVLSGMSGPHGGGTPETALARWRKNHPAPGEKA